MNICLQSLLIGGLIIGSFCIISTYAVMKKTGFEDVRELDIAIVTLMMNETRKHCREIKAKRFQMKTAGLIVEAGC